MIRSVIIISSIIIGTTLIKANNPKYTDNNVKSKFDAIKSFAFSATTVQTCSNAICIENTKKNIKQMVSCLYIYRGKSSWIIEKDSKKFDAILDKYPAKKITIGSGNIKVNDIPISQKKIIIFCDID